MVNVNQITAIKNISESGQAIIETCDLIIESINESHGEIQTRHTELIYACLRNIGAEMRMIK